MKHTIKFLFLFSIMIIAGKRVSAQIVGSDTINLYQPKLNQQEIELKSLNKQVNDLFRLLQVQKAVINQQSKQIDSLEVGYENQNKILDTIRLMLYFNKDKAKIIEDDLRTKIQETQTTANDGLAKLDKNLSKNKLYWTIATLITLLLGGFIYRLLGRRISSNKTDVEMQIRNTKKSLEEESVKLDNKLIEVLETQLKISQAEQTISNNTDEEIDHSLALKVADEIVRMQKNITRMDEGTKGLKPLVKGIERIQANFAANGYEMVNLLNAEYDDRMNIDVINFIDDDNIEKDKKIITKVIKPQVNYKGVLIQRAQVDVSQN